MTFLIAFQYLRVSYSNHFLDWHKMRKITKKEEYHDLLSPSAPRIFRMFGIATPKRPRPEFESEEEEGPYRPRRRGKCEASLGSQDGMSL